MKTAIVIGATGLIGNHLTKKLLANDEYSKVKVFVRRSLAISDSKLEENIVDFDAIEKWGEKLTGDILFSALGTTIKKAGSKEAQYKIDFTYQYRVAQAASLNGVEKYLLVSSSGANSNSKNFYLRIKGELEDEVEKLRFKNIFIFQPSLLLGEREEKRTGETIGAIIAKIIIPLIPAIKKYRPIQGSVVADAMINAAAKDSSLLMQQFVLDEIFDIRGNE